MTAVRKTPPPVVRVVVWEGATSFQVHDEDDRVRSGEMDRAWSLQDRASEFTENLWKLHNLPPARVAVLQVIKGEKRTRKTRKKTK